jgi:hypothetical protein
MLEMPLQLVPRPRQKLAAYRRVSKADELIAFAGEAGQKETSAIQWLLN